MLLLFLCFGSDARAVPARAVPDGLLVSRVASAGVRAGESRSHSVNVTRGHGTGPCAEQSCQQGWIPCLERGTVLSARLDTVPRARNSPVSKAGYRA